MPKRGRVRRNPARYDDRMALELIEQHIRRLLRLGDGWATRHADAMVEGAMFTDTSLRASGGIAQMVYGWASYADAYRLQWGSTVGDDRVLGPAWARAGQAIEELLNGHIGQLDAGATSTLLYHIAELNGVTGFED